MKNTPLSAQKRGILPTPKTVPKWRPASLCATKKMRGLSFKDKPREMR
jgi:hypothetical protein